MQAAPAPSSPSLSPQTKKDEGLGDTAGEPLPSEENTAVDRSSVNANGSESGPEATMTTKTSPAPTTALPGIRDLFPDHLFEAQQRLERPIDPRSKDPFLCNVSSRKPQLQERSESDREMQREAFVALTSPFPRSPPIARSPMQPRSPYAERGAFMFPRPSSTTRAPALHPSIPLTFVPSSIPTPGRVTIPSSIPSSSTSTAVSSPTSTRTEPARPRARGHAHTYSSDASAAAAGLLGLSLSGGPPPSTALPTTTAAAAAAADGIQERHANEGDVETDDNDDDSMFVFEMDEARERVKGREENKEQEDEMEMEGVETAPTSVDSHISGDPKPKDDADSVSSERKSKIKSSPKGTSTEPSGEGTAEAASPTENDNAGDREPASSAENEGAEGEADGDGDGGDGKRHTCPHCKKRFNRPSSLKIHLNTHTGAKPFECPYPGCGRQFNVSSNMRRHYRNHSSPAGMPGAGSGMGMGMGIPMGIHESFGPRPPPPGVLGLHVGPSGFPTAQHMQIQMQRELDRERLERERMALQGHAREAYAHYGPPHVAPSAYRPPPQTNGVPLAPSRVPPPPGPQHGAPYGPYPAGFGPRESELDRRERVIRMERENWELRELERERERVGRMERRIPPGYAPPGHPTTFQQGRVYAQHSPPLRERPLEYRMGPEPGRSASGHYHYQQVPTQGAPPSYAHPNSHGPPHPQPQPPLHHPQSQARPPGAGPAPGLRASHSFSHPYTSPHAHPYARASPSQSRSRERYSSGAGSPVVSPVLSAASSLPVRGWRGHSHTHSAPAFAGQAPRGVELPPLMTAARSPFERDGPLPIAHGRSQSYSSPGAHSAHVSPAPPLPPLSNLSRAMDAREDERMERKARRDSTAALTGHESDREAMQDATSDFENEDRRMGSDVDMRDAIREDSSRVASLRNGDAHPSPRSVRTIVDAAARSDGRDDEIRSNSSAAATLASPVQTISPSFQSRNMELRRRPSNPQSATVSGASSSRERAYSHSQYSHSRTGSNSSSGHGHDYISHPYARARHAHSRSREAAVVAADMVSPRLVASMSTSPHPSLPSMSASVSPRTSAPLSSFPSPRQIQIQQKGANAEVHPHREPSETDRGLKVSSPVSATGRASRFPVYTFPPPAPPPGVVIPSRSPVGGAAMEVEN